MERLVAVHRALRTAAPHALPDAVRAALRQHYGAERVELLLVDYGLSVLQPVTFPPGSGRPLSARQGPQGRAFGSQRPVVLTGGGAGAGADAGARLATSTVHLPVSVRGDRLGVLSVTAGEERCGEEAVAELCEVAEALGRELAVAERDTDVYARARRRGRLTLAAELQWQSLPGRASVRPEYALGAQLEPAYAVHGDHFDWSADAERLTLTITSGMGEGVDASLLTGLGVGALRNARRAGIPLADQAALADQALWAQVKGEAHLSALLLCFDLATGRVEVVDAGSPRMLRLRDGAVEPVELEAQLPLGMFEETPYEAQEFQVRAGDRLVFVGDGVFAAAEGAGGRSARQAVARAITATRLLPVPEVPPAMLRELSRHLGESGVEDDALVVCLDWYGPRDTGGGRY